MGWWKASREKAEEPKAGVQVLSGVFEESILRHEDSRRVGGAMNITPHARLLLLWLVARENGLVQNVSVLHDCVLDLLPFPREQFDELTSKGLATADIGSCVWEPTDKGRKFLKGDTNG